VNGIGTVVNVGCVAVDCSTTDVFCNTACGGVGSLISCVPNQEAC
jgi:hypothetical protein